MSTEVKKEIGLEIAYVLFIDIVGYSKLVTSEQRRLLELPSGDEIGSDSMKYWEIVADKLMLPAGRGTIAPVSHATPALVISAGS